MTIEKDYLKLRRLVRTNGKHVMKKLSVDYLLGPPTATVVPCCILCGTERNITKEHVLPKWVFESDGKRFFKADVNQLPQFYIKATLPACKSCNSELLNNIERYIQKTLTEVDLKNRYYSPQEWTNVIRWLEIIDYKFQVLDIMTKFRAHKTAGYVPYLSDFPIAVIRDVSVRSVKAKVRLALNRISAKNKTKMSNSLIVGRTIEKTFHYFHTSGKFIHLELPTYNKAFFYFYEKEYKSDKGALKSAKKIIDEVYKTS